MTIKYQIERQCYKDRKKRHTKFESMINRMIVWRKTNEESAY